MFRESEAPPQVHLDGGTILDGRYQVLECLGVGSLGSVYKCRCADFPGSFVAVKVISPDLASDKSAITRLRNELVASYDINHPNVVKPYELFQHNDLTAFSMEYVGGGDLGDLLGSKNALSLEDITSLLSQICLGLQAVHNAGVVHRDLKPENVLMTPQGQVKIADFGTALFDGGIRVTEKGSVVGTINYMSPESLDRGVVDERSDIYSLGVVAYEMFAGRLPFRGDSIIETMNLKMSTDPEPLTRLDPTCPPLMWGLVSKAMRRSPVERFSAIDEVLEILGGL